MSFQVKKIICSPGDATLSSSVLLVHISTYFRAVKHQKQKMNWFILRAGSFRIIQDQWSETTDSGHSASRTWWILIQSVHMYKLNSWNSIALFWRACHLHWQQLQAMRGWGGSEEAVFLVCTSEEAVFWYVLVAQFILEMDHLFGMSLGKEMVAHLIIRPCINTGKQTYHASTWAITVVHLVRQPSWITR